jgi:hypothetical protein
LLLRRPRVNLRPRQPEACPIYERIILIILEYC